MPFLLNLFLPLTYGNYSLTLNLYSLWNSLVCLSYHIFFQLYIQLNLDYTSNWASVSLEFLMLVSDTNLSGGVADWGFTAPSEEWLFLSWYDFVVHVRTRITMIVERAVIAAQTMWIYFFTGLHCLKSISLITSFTIWQSTRFSMPGKAFIKSWMELEYTKIVLKLLAEINSPSRHVLPSPPEQVNLSRSFIGENIYLHQLLNSWFGMRSIRFRIEGNHKDLPWESLLFPLHYWNMSLVDNGSLVVLRKGCRCEPDSGLVLLKCWHSPVICRPIEIIQADTKYGYRPCFLNLFGLARYVHVYNRETL